MSHRAALSRRALWVAIALGATAAVLVLIGVDPVLDILKPDQSNKGGLGEFVNMINDKIKGPANAVMISFSGVGLAAGGTLTATGQSSGPRLMGMSACAGGAVGLGNLLIE